MSVLFEKQASGYKVKRTVRKNDKCVVEILGTITRSNAISRDYNNVVDLDGNISSWYRNFHAKANYFRYLEKAILELKRPYTFNIAKKFTEEDPDASIRDILSPEEFSQLQEMLMKMNSLKERSREIREFQEYARAAITDLSSFVKGTGYGRYSPGSSEPSLKEQSTGRGIIK